MPNWCANSIAIFDASKTPNGARQLQNLYLAIAGVGAYVDTGKDEKKELKEISKDYYESDGAGEFSNGWMGQLLLETGIATRIGDPLLSDSRGFLSSQPLWEEDPIPHIRIEIETAWGPKENVLRTLVDKYDCLDFVYRAEECGIGIYINTDVDHIFFSEEYRVDAEVDGEYAGDLLPDGGYCESAEDAIGDMKMLLDELRKKYPDAMPESLDFSMIDVDKAAERLEEIMHMVNEKHKDDGDFEDCWLSFNKYEC